MRTLRNRKPIGLETKKARYGFIFLAPWIVGIAMFFIFPIVQSIIYSFAEVEISPDGAIMHFAGLSNYHRIIMEDPTYMVDLTSAVSSFFVSMPFILVVSLILALFLNDSFRGRLFFRALYFVPVILASGPALNLFLTAASNNATEVAVTDAVSFSMMDFTEVLSGLGLPTMVEDYLIEALNGLFMMVWQSGIQIVLFIAGLQSIPELMYEVAKVEGATKWEEFWYVTLPMLLRPMLLVIVFTMVENITSQTNPVVSQAYQMFENVKYGLGSAMLWFYFAIAGAIVALLLLLYSKIFLKRWG